MRRTAAVALCCSCVLLALGGCTRSHYRLKADREAYSLLAEKSACAPWSLPTGFSVYPDPRSRFYDQTPTDDPYLPLPSPQLYAYSLPNLPDRDPSRFRPHQSLGTAIIVPPNELLAGGWSPQSGVAQASAIDPNAGAVHFAYLQTETTPDPLPNPPTTSGDGLPSDGGQGLEELPLQPIPKQIWDSLPPGCLERMFEFESVREEYQRTYKQQPSEAMRDASQRLTLEDIVELAQINSREFQAQKESLYDTALLLSLERYNYDLKFATSGNGTSPIYTHNRNAGITVDRLVVPSTATSERVLATGGDFLARFANDVVLTFNGPDGFAADVGSSLLFDVSQRIFQRDIVFETLTQSERRVVYAARDFGRARKELFVTLSGQYYDLLLTYRAIEIATQDYFSNLRGFYQAEAEEENADLPRFQVDQFEQRALTSRRGLISAANNLELSLDRLKLQIGIPPELPINLDLRELEELTLRDEVTAAAERVERAKRRLQNMRSRPEPQRDEMLNEAIRLVTEALDLLGLRERRGETVAGIEILTTELAQMEVEEMRLTVRNRRDELNQLKDRGPDEKPADSLQLILRTAELIDSLLRLTERELTVAQRVDADAASVTQVRGELQRLWERYNALQADLNRQRRDVADRIEQLNKEEQVLQQSDELLTDAEGLALEADSLMPPRRIDPEGEMKETLELADELIERSQQLLEETQGGLVPIEIDVDEAMLTALTLRYDVMTERERLADVWRRVKLTADDLKSVLNLNAAQTIRTRSDVNRPFDFTFDDSQTRLALTFDAPLNRKRQRNAYRRQLINYNQAFRNLMAVEDNIKFAVRNDLRQLQFQREQYRIAVSSAALAYQRRVSTNLQYRLGIQNIRAQDVLEAQQDYTQSLVALASAHIDYIQRRITFFLDIELLEVNDNQFWPELYDEQYQPVPSYQLPEYAQPAYGQLPDRVLYSKKVKRMLHVPTGQSAIFRPEPTGEGEPEEILTPHAEGPSEPRVLRELLPVPADN